MSSSKIKNISLLQKSKSGYMSAHPVPPEGRIMIATNVGRDAVDAGSADNERRESVRRSRVVLTPRCWRQVPGKLTLLGSDGGNRVWAHRGERVISRKAIAQGMSDCLRCPVCSCAHTYYHCARDLGCSAHPAFPAPSDYRRSRKLLANLGHLMPREYGPMLTRERRRLEPQVACLTNPLRSRGMISTSSFSAIKVC